MTKKINPINIFRSFQAHRLFWLTIAIPTFLSIIYFGLIASDIYISEARFVVRSADRQTAFPLGMLLKGSGFSRSQDDSYTVQDYILSRDALHALDEKMNLRAAFKKGDIFNRFHGLDRDDSFENMQRYYRTMVDVQIDSISSIGTLRVRAFSADEAQKINGQLLLMAETRVNQLNERGRQDMIHLAVKEVTLAEERTKKAALTLAAYRNQKGVIDPERQSAIPLQQIAKLQDELIANKSLLAQLQLLTKENPQIPVLKKRIQMLKTEIEIESGQVAGSSGSLASKVADFQRLALEKEFSDKQLASALASLEQARNEAQRQQLYLERIAQPSLPDAAIEPRRLRGVLATFILGLIAWGVLTMIVAGVQEHMD